MSTNLAPIPDRTPAIHQGIGALGPGSPALGAGSGPKTSPIVRYLAALNRFKWLVLFLAACGFGGGYLMSRLLRESYVVTGSFYVVDNGEGGNNGPIQGAPTLTNEQWKDFIRGYQVVTPVVIGRQLFIIGPKRIGSPPPPPGPSGENAAIFRTLRPGPKYAPGTYELAIGADGRSWKLTDSRSGSFQEGQVGVDSIGTQFGFEWFPLIESRWNGQSFAFDAITPREAADQIRTDLKITAAPRARYIYLELAGQDKEVTAGTLNDLMHEVVRLALIQKRTNLMQASAIYDSTLLDSESELRAKEQALSAFQTRTVTLPRQVLQVAPGLQSTTIQGFSEFTTKQTELQNLRRDRADLDSALALLKADRPVEDRFNSIPDVASRSELLAKVREYGELKSGYERSLLLYTPIYTDSVVNMPRLKGQIDELRTRTIPYYAGEVRNRMTERITQIAADLQTAQGQLQEIPDRAATENKLKRELATAEDINKSLTSNAYAAKLREKTALNDLIIQDEAVAPLRPTKNRKKVILALGMLAGLAAGLGIAFLLDLFDKRVRYADQITSGLGLTILGVVPEIRRIKGGSSTAEEDSQVIEAFRTIRLNLAHAAPEGRLMLTISSPAPAEGKSLVSSNLALSFAEAGYRTLLIDGDTRRGELHRTFGVDRRPGLIDYLADNHPVAELLRPTTHPLLTLIPSGSRKRNAPELLGSLKMRELVASYRERFDVILIDSPPLGAGIDPFVLGTLTGNLMLVVRAGSTQKDLAETKLQIVDQLPIRLVGAVLNDVSASTDLYRYYSYSSGYAAFDEQPEAGKLQVSSGSGEKPS